MSVTFFEFLTIILQDAILLKCYLKQVIKYSNTHIFVNLCRVIYLIFLIEYVTRKILGGLHTSTFKSFNTIKEYIQI